MNIRTAAVAVFIASSGLPSAAQEATLRYRWTQGDVLVYKTTLKTVSTVGGTQGTGAASFEQTMTQRIRLLAAAVGPDGSATLQQTTEAVSIEMSGPMAKVFYDSADPKSAEKDPAAAALGRVFGGMVGQTISITMAASGAIQRIDGVQRVYDKIAQDLPTDRTGAPVARGLKSVLSDEAVRASLEQSFPKLPPQPIKAGETWTGQIALGSDVVGRIGGTQTFTLKSLDGSLATITVALALKQESAPPIGPAGMTMKLGESKGDGQIEFDVATGRIRKSTMKTEMPSTMSTVGPDGQPAEVRNTTKTSMAMELVER